MSLGPPRLPRRLSACLAMNDVQLLLLGPCLPPICLSMLHKSTFSVDVHHLLWYFTFPYSLRGYVLQRPPHAGLSGAE